MSKAKFESTVGSIQNSRRSQNGISRQSSQGRNQPETFKVIVIGDSNVGKTCLALRLCSGVFKDRREPTIGFDFQYKTVRIGDKEVKVRISTTWGSSIYYVINFQTIFNPPSPLRHQTSSSSQPPPPLPLILHHD